MGCDIHAVVQVRHGDRWETVQPPEGMYDEYRGLPWEIRNYTLFGVLAGVRNPDVTPIAQPRGLPDDDPNIVLDGGDGEVLVPNGDAHGLGEHSFSWLTAAEIADYDLTAESEWDGNLGEATGIPSWLPWLLSLGEPNDVRLVFGFDS